MTTTIQHQPDISYHPDYQKYILRTERLKAEISPNIEVPVGFPKHLTGPLVWEGKDYKDEKEWTFNLTPGQLVEIHDALLHFKCMYSDRNLFSNH
jgi:hypothetical protein